MPVVNGYTAGIIASYNLELLKGRARLLILNISGKIAALISTGKEGEKH